MSATDRFVRHLRLQAGSEADVRRVLPRIEDALRCASLPDDGARLCVVRKLALGRIARDASSQSLSRVIEQRVAEVGGQWVAGGTAAAAQADFVNFSSSLEARAQLAVRLVRGELCDAWYWPLAVPEFRSTRGVAENLQGIFQTLAQLPEARAALPAWSVKLIEEGGAQAGDMLAAAITPVLAERLLQQADIALLDEGTRSLQATPLALATTSTASVEPDSVTRAGTALHALPRWIRSLLVGSKAPRYQELIRRPAAFIAPQAEGRTHSAPTETLSLAELTAKVQLAPVSPVLDRVGVTRSLQQTEAGIPAEVPHHHSKEDLRTDGVSDAVSPSRGDGALASGAIVADGPEVRAVPMAEAAQHADGVVSDLADDLHPAFARSAGAGLFFLLPVLVRLGLVQWAEQEGDAGDFALHVLAAALRRLRVSGDDSAWQLVVRPGLHADASPRQTGAPTRWDDAVLRSPKPGSVVQVSDMLCAASNVEEQAEVWLTAARRCLRRAGGIGLASLVLRPGQISSTPTHIDLYFSVDDTDMRVRRLGLDIDPGWLPWLGKVVSYHYRKDAS